MSADKQRGVKTKAILDYLKQHPEAKPGEVVDALAKLGLKIRPGLVSNLKYQTKSTANAPVPEQAPPTPNRFTVEEVLAAKWALDKFEGNMDRLIAATKQIQKAQS